MALNSQQVQAAPHLHQPPAGLNQHKSILTPASSATAKLLELQRATREIAINHLKVTWPPNMSDIPWNF
jgi:hypothetical protein